MPLNWLCKQVSLHFQTLWNPSFPTNSTSWFQSSCQQFERNSFVFLGEWVGVFSFLEINTSRLWLLSCKINGWLNLHMNSKLHECIRWGISPAMLPCHTCIYLPVETAFKRMHVIFYSFFFKMKKTLIEINTSKFIQIYTVTKIYFFV